MLPKRAKLLFLFLFVVGITSILAFRLWQVKKVLPASFFPQESSFDLKPPTEALEGEFISIKGDVKKEPRNKEEFEAVKAEGEVLVEGEKIATGEKSQATIEFPDFIRIDLGSNTEIGLVNLMPANFLISQSSGFAAYRLLQNDNGFSVRSLHALLTFYSSTNENKVLAKPGSYSGESEVTVEEEKIIVKVLSGKAKLALVDLENKTHVWELEEGQEVLINDTERRVEVE